MASGAGPTLAHRSVASIRGGPSDSPSTPRTPTRGISSTYGSPSAVRADDEVVLIELGSRHVRVGFAGDSAPKAVLQSGPEDQRRAGDFRSWQGSARRPGLDWIEEHEMWRYDVRGMDLGLFQDRLERLLKDAFTRFLLIDSRPRRVGLVLDSAVPVPLLTAVLDTMFNKFQSPIISLMSTASMSTVAAGVRSALVINMGWTETVVTSVYEYREVKSTRTIRGGSMLLDALYTTVRSLMVVEITEDNAGRAISFDECEDIMCRLMWCRSSAFRSSQRQSAQLETVEEQDESLPEISQSSLSGAAAQVPLTSAYPPTTIEMPFEMLADVCDETFFDPKAAQVDFDDHELPIHLLVYQHLLQLPIDVRAICMSRIMFTGGCSNILGLKERIVDELTSIIDKRGWAPVTGKGVDQLRNNPKLHRKNSSPQSADGSLSPSDSVDSNESASQATTHIQTDLDTIEAKVMRNKEETRPLIQGQIRVLHSLGPWAGASLMCQLRVPAMAIIDRDVWLQQGANGASRPVDVDVKAQQRQSVTPGGFIRGSGGHHGNWTLGTWGYLS